MAVIVLYQMVRPFAVATLVHAQGLFIVRGGEGKPPVTMGLLKPTIHTGKIRVVYRTIPCPGVCRPSQSPPVMICSRS